jgi:hypothetical protein
MTDQTSFKRRIGRRRVELFRVAVLVAAFVALIVSAAVTVGASPTASSAPAAQQPAGSPGTGDGHRGGFGGLRFPFFFGGQGSGGPGPAIGGGRFGGLVGLGGVTVTKIDGSSISLKTDDGWTRTITVGSDTKITKGTETATLSDLKVGDTIRFSQQKQSDGSYTITRIAIVVPRVDGTVSATDANGFTVKKFDGTTTSVTVDGSTKYMLGGGSGSKSDVTVGSRIDVQGTPGSGSTFAADVVTVQPAFVAGTITAVGSDSITVKKFDGSSATIHVDSSTTFRVSGASSAKISDLKVGDRVTATGRLRSDGSLDAQSVFSGSFRGPGKRPALPGPDASAKPSS